jgi:hypothetical protein
VSSNRGAQLDLVKQATANVRAELRAVIAACNEAGLPRLAADFIASETPIAAVRNELARRKNDATAAGNADNHASGDPFRKLSPIRFERGFDLRACETVAIASGRMR